MRKEMSQRVCFTAFWLTAFSLLVFATGCSDPDRAGNNPGVTAPTVNSVIPASGATGTCASAAVTATFSKAMNPSTINATTFTLTGPASAPVAGQVTYDATNNTAIFTPTNTLALNTAYTATITSAARDMFGNQLASNRVWSFTTGNTMCQPGLPAVISVVPAGGSATACANTIVTATFNQAMNPSSIDGTTFTLTGPGTTPVAGQVTYDAASNTAIFTPPGALALSTLYTSTITTGVQAMSGGSLAANFVWTFSTAATACQPPAPPVSVTPPNGATAACQNSVIAVTFPQAMNPATINQTTFKVTPGVTGTVTHDVTNKIFTLTPSANLALNTNYTGTITTGATDMFGNALASNFVWTFTTADTACAGAPPPAVIAVAPADGALGVCPNSVVTATFNEAMNPVTINNLTFTVTPGVTGIVTLDGTARIAVFTPTANLALNTTYTATITTGAQDMPGNPLPANFTWSFTTATLACQAPVPLGSAAAFEALAGSTVTNTGPTIISGGNLGLSPGTAVTGFPPGSLVPPAVMDVTNPTAAQAELDLVAAYIYAAGLQNPAVLPGNLSGLTFTPGLYKTPSTVVLSTGNVTLDGQGDANAVFIFQIGSTLTTIGSTHVILAGGAQAKNIFWQVGSSATLGTNSSFQGTIIALQSITMDTGATLTGRLLARNGAVALDSNIITAP